MGPVNATSSPLRGEKSRQNIPRADAASVAGRSRIFLARPWAPGVGPQPPEVPHASRMRLVFRLFFAYTHLQYQATMRPTKKQSRPFFPKLLLPIHKHHATTMHSAPPEISADN